jgi:hypothetical protein
MKTFLRCLPIILASISAAGVARAEWQVGAIAQTVRVLREDPPPADRTVQLAAARNESRGFQVLLRSDAPVRIVAVEMGDLAGPGGAVLRGADADLYRQHQMELTVATPRNDRFRPGWYPDPLIPLRHPLTGRPLAGARLAAVPFDLPAGQTHGFWIDLHVPADARPGEYRGVCRVTAEGGRAVEVPVALTVWDFALPATPTLKTAFGSPAGRLRGYYQQRAKEGKEPPVQDWAAVETQCAEMLSRHRINATPPAALAPQPQADGSFRFPPDEVKALREFIDRYHVNALQTPHPASVVKNPDGERAKLHAWLKAFDALAADLARPGLVFFTYLKDEPNDAEAYKYVQTWGKAVREARSAVKVLVVEQTRTQDPAWGDLYGAVDIWCPLFSLFDAETSAQRRALGETVWTYTALCQGRPTPWWHIDYPLLNYRVPAWIAWRFRETGLLYWGGMSHWREVDDPWTDPRTYGRAKDPKAKAYNGEGTLVYPGRAAGYDGIAPSLRLKALRDSVQDYEYLAILERAGRAAEAEPVVLPLAGSWFEWDKDPAAYDAARSRLAALILAPPKR